MEKPIFAVGTENKIKIKAVTDVVKKYWPGAKCMSYKVSTGVSNQPKTDTETKTGAVKRAKKALEINKDANYGVGLESGIEFRKDGLWTFGWVAIIGRDNAMGLAKTIQFRLPDKLGELIKSGLEQGQADAILFKRVDSGEKGGTVGLLTKGKVKRVEVFSQAIVFALVPFLNKELYS
jgi:inosine/xanthosine triphosphatase